MTHKKMMIICTVPNSLLFFSGQVKELKNHFNIHLVSSDRKLLKKISTQEGVAFHEINMRRDISLFNDIKSLLSLIRLFLKEKPHIVHGNTPKGALLSLLAARLLKVPIRIYYVHGLRYEGTRGMKRRLLKMIEKISCFCATHVYAVSHGIKSTMERSKLTSKDIKIIWNGSINGVNMNYFNPNKVNDVRKELDIPKNSFVFGYVGRLVADKGVNELVESFIDLTRSARNIKLLLVGAFEQQLNPLTSWSREQIMEHPDIIWVGPKTDVRPYYKSMDLLIFPSYREGFGMVLIESASMGLTAISSNISGCNEIIENNINGILIPPRDQQSLLKAMKELSADAQKLKELKLNNRKRIRERYTQDLLWKKSISSYQTLN